MFWNIGESVRKPVRKKLNHHHHHRRRHQNQMMAVLVGCPCQIPFRKCWLYLPWSKHVFSGMVILEIWGIQKQWVQNGMQMPVRMGEVPSFTSVFGLCQIRNTFNIIQLDTQT